MGVVHAHGWVVIDCRVPQESVIRIVSTMGTKESISYKMISHGSWYRQIEKERGRANSQVERGRERKSNSRVKREKKRRGRYSRKKERQKAGVCRCCRVEVSEKEKNERESEMESECVEERGREKDK